MLSPNLANLMRTLAIALISCISLYAQTTTKDKPADYPVHATLGATSLGAEYLVHSIPAGNQTLLTPEYLVFEVAVFPPRGGTVEIASGTFTLRLNGKKQVLYPVSPGFVAGSLKYPDWEIRPNAQATVGMGDAGVVIGRPPVVGRFPDDPRPGQSRLPRAPKAPVPDDQRGVEHEAPESIDQIIARTALPDGPAAKPVSGYLYFAHKGKAKTVKSLELIYQDKADTVTLKLL
jgi:hypothetical protein